MKPPRLLPVVSALLLCSQLHLRAQDQNDPESATRSGEKDSTSLEQALPSMDEKEMEAAWNSAEGRALHATWEREGWRFTPAVKAAYLTFARAAALRELASEKIILPADFLKWVDADPVVAATVYGARHDPAAVLVILRSLELDLGVEEVRHKHTQLALAMAVVHSRTDEPSGKKKQLAPATGLGISLAARPLLKLQIPGNPLKPVDTHPKDRPLDLNDHIVNFFEGRTVEVTGKGGKKGEPAPVKTVPMAACDVLADPKLQAEFNAYMKAHGQNVEVHCGDHVVARNSTAAVKGPDAKGILEAFQLFKTAYEEKGLLPARRDAMPTLAETCAWLIRNDPAAAMPEGVKRKWDHWPLFPLDAPWPVLTYLAQNRQPLRECEDIFTRYRDKGEFHGYGEYIGPIAQQFNFQSARRLAPYDYSYGTFQMMLKDGGVCGTMANIQSRSELALGIPSTTAGQPGHCALVSMRYDAKDKTSSLAGSQFVTAGPSGTTPHLPWVFGDDSTRRPMIYPMSTTYAVNHGVQPFLDSSMAWKMCVTLPAADRTAHGLALLQSGIGLDPYNLLLVDTACADLATPQALADFSDGMERLLAAPDKRPKELYNETVLDRLCARLAKLPLPTDKALLSRLADLTEKAGDATAWQKIQTALHGAPAVQATLLDQLKAGVAGQRTPEGTDVLAKRIQALAAALPKSTARTTWVDALLIAITGHETYTVKKKSKPDPCAAVILKLAGKSAEAAAREAARAKEQSDAASRDLSKDKDAPAEVR